MRVLFIGNSHTYFNDMPRIFQQLMEANGQPVEITMLAVSGQTLEGHIRNEQTRFNILYGHYDMVILQESTTDFPEAKEYLQRLTTIKGWCDEAGSACALFMNYSAPENTPPLSRMEALITGIGGYLGVKVARVGEAFQKAGIISSEIDLYFSDHHHASFAGSYLIALVIARDVFGVRTRGLPALTLDEGDAKNLQRVAQAL